VDRNVSLKPLPAGLLSDLKHVEGSHMPVVTPSTVFTRDVLGRYICSTWEEATADPDGIDVVVLGAGLYGGYCAASIHQRSQERLGQRLRVLVLDAGPFVVPEHTQNIPDLGFFDPGGEGPINVGPGSKPGVRNEVWGVGWRSNQPFVGQAYCVGGKGIFWGGWCPRLQTEDLAQWPEEVRNYLTIVDEREPLGRLDPVTKTTQRGDGLSGYEALEYEIGVKPSDDFVFDPLQKSGTGLRKVGLNEALRVFLDKGKAGIDSRIRDILENPIAVQTQSPISGLFALDKYSSVPALTAAVRNDHGNGREKNLRMALVPNVHVVRVGFRPDAQAPERGTRVIDRIDVIAGGIPRSLPIRPHCQVVLAMSCIESTRLALESFSLEGSGLRAPGDELMGRNFMVHLRFDVAFDIDRAKFGEWVKTTWQGFQLADVLQLAAAHIQCNGASGRYQYQLYAATNSAGPDANMYRMVPDREIRKQIENGFQSDKIRLVLRASGEVQGGRNTSLKDPRFDYIDLAGEADNDKVFGHRRAFVQFNRGDHFTDPIWQEMHDTVHAIARALNGGTPPDYRGADFTINAVKRQQGVGTTFHDSGTLWTGDDPDSSVTDVNGHFHHVTNAYCCDQGLFTTVGSTNPALTGLVLANKVASDIVNRHRGFIVPSPTGLVARSLLPEDGWLQAPYAGMVILDRANNGILETNPFQGIGLYYLNKELADFDLAIEFKTFRTAQPQGEEVIANSGILLRAPDPKDFNLGNPAEFNDFYDQTTEIQIDETGKNFSSSTGRSIFGDSRFKTGAIYGIVAAKQWAANVGSPDGAGLGDRYWNTYEISASGTDVSVTLNGKPVCKADMPPEKRSSGFIGLQFHTGRVQFRNLRLRIR
jgi:choline dehydrogenase-like flavoprotein